MVTHCYNGNNELQYIFYILFNSDFVNCGNTGGFIVTPRLHGYRVIVGATDNQSHSARSAECLKE